MRERLTEHDLTFLRQLAQDPDRLLAGDEISEEYSHDELSGTAGWPQAVFRAKNVAEVSAVMRYANEHAIPVTPRGAGTGLVGAAVAVAGGILLDLSLMNQVLELDEDNLTLTVEPGVLLMDEPLSNLDAKLRVQMRIEIAKLHQRLGTTIIYVTHDQTEAMTLGTRIVVMKDGLVQQVDTPQNLYEKPQNLFVAGFMGSPQMNFIDATVDVKGDTASLKVAGLSIPLPPAKSKKLIDGGYSGKTVTFGIRPEDIYDSQMMVEAKSESTFETTIRVYELLGAEVFLYADLAEFPITARVDPRTTARPGDKVKFAIDIEKIHVFDKDTEKIITN